MATTVLRHVLLLQRDVPRAAKFYADGLGLQLRTCTERWAELQAGPTRLALKAVDGVGYSPILSFDVKDLDSTVARLIGMGGILDGPIRYREHGKLAAMRAPDGHMLGLYEPHAAAPEP